MTSARATYLDASIATASPTRLLVMLYERLVLDVQRALDAQRNQNIGETHRQLTHAQDIVMELHSSLRPEGFKGGRELGSLYGYLHRQLVLANVRKDADLIAECLQIVTELCDTWRQAALESAGALAKGA
ncbi:flagellar export chaperone FliS [Nocardioides marmoriginsengisoli]|uniref:Flagellar export chaperone FliS n=2 Tax=Nocardioides marmoriginsengisoli TaxID=661483 RepID=A0A3N0CD52_9ACTN|nr:flagellar export chaperone FliS [Nocardioides marmoriginsengisoli]